MGSGSDPDPLYGGRGAYFYVVDDGGEEGGEGAGGVRGKGGKDGDGGREEGERVVSFELVGFKIKPIAVPPGGDVRVVVQGYPHNKSNTNTKKGKGEEKVGVREWSVIFPEGYDEMFEVRMREFARRGRGRGGGGRGGNGGKGGRWEGLRGVEVRALYGVQELDWEFCLDDLVVVFEGVGGEGVVGGGGLDGGRGEEGEERMGEGKGERGQVVLG